MKTFVRLITVGVLFVLLGASTLTAQGVTYSTGPAVPIALAGANGGFSWGDVNGDGYLDALIRQNNLLINQVTSFTPLTNTGLPSGQDGCGLGLADFNGDGYLDAFGIAQNTWVPWLYIDSVGVSFKAATGTGDLVTAGGTGVASGFGGMTVADYDRDNNLDMAWTGAHGIWLLKGSASGAFTHKGNSSSAPAIDTSLSYESWEMSFLDANNDGYSDLLAASFRQGYQKFNTGTAAYRKGCVFFVNDGNGKFYVPTAAKLGRTIYELDSISAGVIYAGTKADTGIIVDDTVRHFEAIAHAVGDFNNDGIMDLYIASNSSNNLDARDTARFIVLVYGKGDGTFTYKWNGTSTVANNGLTQNGGSRSLNVGDYNNDGNLDVVVGCFGAGVYSQYLYRNNGDGTFTDVSTASGINTSGTRSVAFVEYNNDGFLDIYTYTNTTTVLMKNSGNSNHWIGFKPIGTGNNKSAVGAVLTIYTGLKKQIRAIRADAGSAASGEGLRANFGLGTATAIDSLVVQWPDGVRQKVTGIPSVNRYWTVKEGVDVPAVPVLVGPANGVDGVPIDTTLSWNTAVGAVAYQCQVSLDSTFATGINVNDTLTGTTKQLTGLGNSSTYYWRVRSIGTITNGFVSAYATRHFTTIAHIPDVPVLALPADNALDLEYMVTLTSYKTKGAAHYHWQLSTALAFSSLAVNDSTTDSVRVVGPLASGTKYYWKVRAVNPGGPSEFSAPDSFTVMAAPGATTLAYPTSNQKSVSADNLKLKWHPASIASGYECQISLSKSFSTLAVASDSTADTTFTATLDHITKYYWRVRGFTVGGNGPFTAIDSFTTIVPIPAAPTLVSPRSVVNVPRNPTIIWHASTYATRYRLQIATNSSFIAIVLDTTVADTTVWLRTMLDANKLYYWQVSATDTLGTSAYSTPAHFTTGTTSIDQAAEIPKEFALLQNYPNPFNPSTTIGYDLPKNAYVKIIIYDMLGKVVANLVDGMQAANRYTIEWNPSHLSSGIYFYRIEARSQDGSANFTAVKKLLFMK